MAGELPNPSHTTLLKHWSNVLHLWQDKRSQYEQQHIQTTSASHQQDLQQKIIVCQDVIQTAQALIQALSESQPDRPGQSIEKTNSQSITLTPSPLSSPQPICNPKSVPTIALSSPSTPPIAPPPETHQPATVKPIPLTRPPRQRPLKPLLGILLPIAIIVITLGIIARPKNICTLSPNGTYSSQGLALHIKQALQADTQNAHQFTTVYIEQQGCSILLKGTVANTQIQTRVISIAQDIKIPSQTPLSRLQQLLGIKVIKQMQPVAEVRNELKIESRQPTDQ